MSTVTLSYNPLLRPPKFSDQYPPELDLRMSPATFATRMRAVNAAVRHPQSMSREVQLRAVVVLSLMIVAVVIIEAAMLEGKSQAMVLATWFLAFLACALVALAGTFIVFAAQYRRRQQKLHKRLNELMGAFNVTDNLVGLDWKLEHARECSGTWLHPNFPWRIVIHVSDVDALEVVEVCRDEVELDPTDLPPPPYSPAAVGAAAAAAAS